MELFMCDSRCSFILDGGVWSIESYINVFTQVMITTTSKETQETEIRVVSSVSGSTLTLDSPLTYEHIGKIQSPVNVHCMFNKEPS